MSDLEARVKKLEAQGGGGCSLLVMLALIWFLLLGWWAGWQEGKTDWKPPFVMEQVGYEEWQSRRIAEVRP